VVTRYGRYGCLFLSLGGAGPRNWVPLLTFESAREYNGAIYAAQVADFVRDLYVADKQSRVFGTFAPGEPIFDLPYFHFGLGHLDDAAIEDGRPPSLNWTLSKLTRTRIAQHLGECVDPSAPKIAEILRAGMYHSELPKSQ